MTATLGAMQLQRFDAYSHMMLQLAPPRHAYDSYCTSYGTVLFLTPTSTAAQRAYDSAHLAPALTAACTVSCRDSLSMHTSTEYSKCALSSPAKSSASTSTENALSFSRASSASTSTANMVSVVELQCRRLPYGYSSAYGATPTTIPIRILRVPQSVECVRYDAYKYSSRV